MAAGTKLYATPPTPPSAPAGAGEGENAVAISGQGATGRVATLLLDKVSNDVLYRGDYRERLRRSFEECLSEFVPRDQPAAWRIDKSAEAPGYGHYPQVTLRDATRPEHWVEGKIPSGYVVTPLYARPSAPPSHEGEDARDAAVWTVARKAVALLGQIRPLLGPEDHEWRERIDELTGATGAARAGGSNG